MESRVPTKTSFTKWSFAVNVKIVFGLVASIENSPSLFVFDFTCVFLTWTITLLKTVLLFLTIPVTCFA